MSLHELLTPEVTKNRVSLMRFACTLWKCSSPASVRTASQIGKAEDLILLLDLDLKNIFHYRKLVREVVVAGNKELQYPTDVAALVAAASKAAEGTLTVEDVAPLVNGDQTVAAELFPEVYPAAASGTAVPAETPAKERKPRQSKKTTEVAEEPPAQKEGQLTLLRPESAKSSQPEAETLDDGVTKQIYAIGEHLNALGRGLAAIADSQVRFSDVFEDALVPILENQKILNANLKTVAFYLDPFVELEELPFQLNEATIVTSPPQEEESPKVVEPVKEAKPEKASKAVKEPAPKAETQHVESRQTAAPEEAEDSEEVDEAVEVTEETLQKGTIEELRTLAEGLGIKGAKDLAYRTVIVKKIRAHLKMPEPAKV